MRECSEGLEGVQREGAEMCRENSEQEAYSLQHGHERLGPLDVWLQSRASRQQEVKARRVPRDARAEQRGHAHLVDAVKRGAAANQQLDQGSTATHARTHQRRETAAVGAVEEALQAMCVIRRRIDEEARAAEVAALAAKVQRRLTEPVGHVEEIPAALQQDAGDSLVTVFACGVQGGAVELAE